MVRSDFCLFLILYFVFECVPALRAALRQRSDAYKESLATLREAVRPVLQLADPGMVADCAP